MHILIYIVFCFSLLFCVYLVGLYCFTGLHYNIRNMYSLSARPRKNVVLYTPVDRIFLLVQIENMYTIYSSVVLTTNMRKVVQQYCTDVSTLTFICT